MDSIKCPRCGSRKIIWRGYRRNKSRDKRLRLCRACGRKFTPDDGYLRMRFKPQVIRKAVGLRRKGFSSAEARKHLTRYNGIKVSRWTIIKWERKYGKKI